MEKFPAFRIRQDEISFYVTRLEAHVLAHEGFSRPDAWSPTNREGYQRPPLERRFKEIADYVLNREGLKPLMPQNIVLNARGKLSFQVLDAKTDFGLLTIPDSVLPLYEVDGQHRLGGLRRAIEEDETAKNYAVPVAIGEGIDKLTEAVLFYLINTTQKKVPTDIAQRLIELQMGEDDETLKQRIIMKGQAWIARATKVVDAILIRAGHPWTGKIGIPGMGKHGVVMRQVSFVQSLKPLLDEGGPFEEEEPEEVARILALYWQAMAELYPEAFADPRNFVIQKTVGVFPLHAVLPRILERVKRQGAVSKDSFKRVLAHLNLDADFWGKEGEAGKYTGAKGFRLLADELKKRLPPLSSSDAVVAGNRR